MRQIKNKRGIETTILLIVIVQIFLLVNYTTANSYSLREIDDSILNSIGQKEKDLFGITDILIGLITIKQIGIVSAQISINCCEKKDDAWCIETDNENDCNQDYKSNPSSCSANVVSFCRTGTCVYNEGETCGENSIPKSCEEGGGTWINKDAYEIPECRRGACVIGDEATFKTRKLCEIESENAGVELDFRTDYDTEFATTLLSNVLSNAKRRGACVSNTGDCRVVNGENCDVLSGKEFLAGVLCTNPSLKENYGVDCEPTTGTMCVDGEDEVYFTDSCSNSANIYNADMVFDGEFGEEDKSHLSRANSINSDDYWSFVIPKENSCGVGQSNAESETCGNCERALSSVCSVADSENEVEYGENICKDISCEYKGETYQNGESWCIYESRIGEGKDTAGSEHFRATCTEGELDVNVCGDGGRTSVCTQSTTEQEVKGEVLKRRISQCAVNEAPDCINYNPLTDKDGDDNENNIRKCQDNSQCIVKNVDVAEYFDFKVCVPKYPQGNPSYCSIANTKCTIYYEKELDGSWSVIANGHCDSSEFSRKMSDLCVSLGDCGSYINYAGTGTNNEIVDDEGSGDEGSGHPNPVSWTRYQGNENPVPGRTAEAGSGTKGEGGNIETGERNLQIQSALERLRELDISNLGKGSPFSQSLIDLADAIQPEEALSDPKTRNSLATAGSIMTTIVAYSGGLSLTTATSSSASANVWGAAAGSGSSTVTLTAYGFATVAVSALLGGIAGAYLAQKLGIGGDAAAAMTIAGATAAGTATATYLTSSSLISGGAVAAGFWVSAGVIAVIIISGVGQREKRDITFSCLPWQAPTGVSDNICGKCNEDPLLKCTDYRCESLGQNCEIRNRNSDNQICVATNRDDTTPPILHAGNTDDGHKFSQNDFDENNEIGLRDSDGSCIKESTNVEFSIDSDEFAQCKWSLDRNELEGDFETLNAKFLGEGQNANDFKKEHSMNYNVPFYESTNLEGELTMYIRCIDVNGRSHVKPYGINICISQGPDETAPEIINIAPEDKSNIRYGEKWKEIDLYLRERIDSLEGTECRYSKTPGINYDEMTAGSCTISTTSSSFIGTGFLCEGINVTNLQPGENKYYIKCRDGVGNTYSNDFEYTLNVAESPLTISSMSVESGETIKNLNVETETATEIKGGGGVFPVTLKVQTTGGINSGVSKCEYQYNNNWITFNSDFPSADSNNHEQPGFDLNNGRHTIPVRCTDEAGNVAEKDAVFRLTIDNDAPRIVRAFSSGGRLSLITNEEAKCYASFDGARGCGFEISNADVNMTSIFSDEHSSGTSSQKTHYIKCVDVYENENAGCAVKISPGFFG